MKRALVLLLLAGCGAPPFVEVSIVNGTAERVVETTTARLSGSFEMRIVAPPGAKPTDVLLIDLDGRYHHPSPCGIRPTQLTLQADRKFPVHVEPGREEVATFTVGAPEPLQKGCAVPDTLDLDGGYYDSVLDEYRGEEFVKLLGEIPLDIDPNLSGPSDYTCLLDRPDPPFFPGTAKGLVWLRDFTSGDLLPGVDVKVCTMLDGLCNAPFDEGTTDIVGVWPLVVPTSEPYFYDVGVLDSFVPTLFFEHIPPAAPGFERIVTAVGQAQLDGILAAMNVTPLAGHGHVVVKVLDCVGEPAIGLVLSVGAGEAVVGYFENNTLSSAVTATTADGFGFIANVPAGPVAVEAKLETSGDLEGSRTFFVRDGAVSFVVVDPTPIQ